ncbi:MAG: hypothetical protein VW620_07565, partial [Rhodospirillales bacterium]
DGLLQETGRRFKSLETTYPKNVSASMPVSAQELFRNIPSALEICEITFSKAPYFRQLVPVFERY